MMADTARAKADRELQRMERHLADIYSRCGKELEKKAADFLADFTRLDEQHKKDVDSGTWTQEEYDEWRKNKLLYGQKWDRLIDYAKKELANANKTAIDYINGKTTQVYADSYNHLQEVIDNSNVKGYNFELVDAETVRNLYDNDELMLPHKDLDKEKDQAWNAKAINAEILQGILQGDSIPKIAQRMNNVATKNDVAAVRTARTMITAAENSGRQAGMNKAEEDGIEFWKMWIATSDERTRESHNVLNGQCIPNGEMFVTIDGEELEFPGDWRADGSEVYNCRCTLGTIIKGFNKKKLDEAIEEQQEQQLEIEQQTEVEEQLEIENQSEPTVDIPFDYVSRFNPEDYTEEAKSNAASFKERAEADKLHRPYLDSIWNNLSIDEKYSIFEYTRGSNGFNVPLLGYNKSIKDGEYLGPLNTDWGQANKTKSVPTKFEEAGAKSDEKSYTIYQEAIKNLTNAIEKSELPQNTYLKRETSVAGFSGIFGVDGCLSIDEVNQIISNGDADTMKVAFIGQQVQNHAFTSTGIAGDVDFGGNVEYKIYAPKGTRAIYAEPQSNFGETARRAPYEAGQDYYRVGPEAEIILQRGTKYMITDFTCVGNKYYVEMEIVEQPEYFVNGDENTADGGKTRHNT